MRHKLPFLTIIDDSGNICGDAGEFVGMKRLVDYFTDFISLDLSLRLGGGFWVILTHVYIKLTTFCLDYRFSLI